jgi:FkbM family methyltransferase
MANLYGKHFKVENEPADVWGWIAKGTWEPHAFRTLDRFLDKSITYLDLGAWIGTHSLYGATLAGRTLAVEPDPVAFEILRKNVSHNPELGIETHQVAIAGHNGTLTIGSGALGHSTTRINPLAGGGIGKSEEFVTVSCCTLRMFCELRGITGPLFIKMDVEGAEELILNDLDWFKEYRPTLYISLHPFWWKDSESMQHKLWKGLAGIYKGGLESLVHNEFVFVRGADVAPL